MKERIAGWSEKDIAIADKLIVGPLGREAAANGWILGLHDFCRHNHRLPSENEKGRVILESSEFDEAFADCCAGRGGAAGEALKRLGESMLARRNKYAAMAMENAA